MFQSMATLVHKDFLLIVLHVDSDLETGPESPCFDILWTFKLEDLVIHVPHAAQSKVGFVDQGHHALISCEHSNWKIY